MNEKPFVLPGLPDFLSVTKAANQSIASGTVPILLTLDTPLTPAQGVNWNPAGNSIVIARRGLYNIGTAVRFTAHATGQRQVCVAVNGANTYFDYRGAAVVGFTHEMHSMFFSQVLNPGDALTLLAAQNSGVANIVLAVAGLLPRLSVQLVRPV